MKERPEDGPGGRSSPRIAFDGNNIGGLLEITGVANVMRFHITEELTHFCKKNGINFIRTDDILMGWAFELFELYKDITIEELLASGITPKSNRVSKIENWEDVSVDFAYFKFAKLQE